MMNRFSRKERPLDAEVARDLQLVDALIADDVIVPSAPADLRAVVLELRAARPEPRPEFAGELDRKVAAGFAGSPEASGEGASGGTTRGGHGRQWLAVGSACAALLVMAVGIGVFSTPQKQGLSLDRPEAAQPDGGEMLSRTAPEAKLLQSDAARTPAARKQVRTARLELAAPAADLEDRADEVVSITDRYRGYVQDSSVTGGDAGSAGATFTLRLPAAQFNDALRDLSKVAHVRSRTQDTLDVTKTFNRTKTALADARAQRSGLLKALAKADTEQEVQSIRLRLRGVNNRIEQIDARMSSLKQRIGYVKLDVAIAATAKDPDGSWSIGDALADAGRVLTTTLGVLIVAMAVLAPFALLLALVALAWRGVVGRRREQVVDGAPPSGSDNSGS